MVREMMAVLAAGLFVATPINAHPLHSSFAEITRDASGALAISVRLFADDFGATLDSLRANSKESSPDAAAQQYFARSVSLFSADGKPIALAWCGMKSEAGLTRVCARSAKPAPPGRYRIRNALMFDRFADQVNIIRWNRAPGTRTLVLSARAPEGLLD